MAVFKRNGEDTLFAIVGSAEVFDETFALKNIGDSNFNVGGWDLNVVMEDGIGIANASEHIGNGISHGHVRATFLPTGFGDTGNGAGIGKIAETDTAELEFTNEAVRSAAEFATVILTSGEFGLLTPLLDKSLFSHRNLLIVREGHTEQGEEFASLLIGVSGGDDDDIHTANFIDFIVVDFREDELLFDAESEIAPAVEGIFGNAPEVANARKSDIHKLIKEVEHAPAAQSDLAADRHPLTEFPSGKRFSGASDDGLLTGDGG